MISEQPVYLNEADLKSVTPAQVETYLTARGWSHITQTQESACYWQPRRNTGSAGYYAVQKSESHWTDYAVSLTNQNLDTYVKSTAQLMITVGVYEGRLASRVLADIKRVQPELSNDDPSNRSRSVSLCWCGERWTPEHEASMRDTEEGRVDRSTGQIPLAHIAVEPDLHRIQHDIKCILDTLRHAPGGPFNASKISAIVAGTLLQEGWKTFAPPHKDNT